MPAQLSPPLSDFIGGLSERDAARAETIDESLAQLEAQITSLVREQRRLGAERKALVDQAQRVLERQDAHTNRPSRAADYTQHAANLSQDIVSVARQYWPRFEQFRYCQEGVVRAVLDRRHVFVVMPTGGGKSFCYQLPALMQPGITLVISPLVSLMYDQVEHAREQGIPCDLMTGATPREEKTRLNRLVRGMKPENNPPIAGPAVAAFKESSSSVRPLHEDERPLKLLYVTPEQLTKNKTLRAALQNAEEAGALARIVVDEAHCCSQYGHDYRPDYRKLDLLTKFFTHTPLSCFTATAPYTVMEDVVQCLGLPKITSADQALPNTTVHFSSPLIRANLTYSVLPKSIGKDEYSDVADYILSHHEGETGIIYCLSQKNTEDMAAHLTQLSDGRIQARAYHAGMFEEDRTQIHRRWTVGKAHVICATTAFGMGIDKPDVRYVLHATMPTSIEGLYQESGRAGRDGKPADCVLFYRPQDGVRISSVASDSPGGSDKVRGVLEYSQTLECRKVFFSRYFEDEHSDFSPCGSCDNCAGTSNLGTRDASVEAWKSLHALTRIKLDQGRVTLGQLTELVRGNNRGRYEVLGGPDGRDIPISPAVRGVKPPGNRSKVGALDMDDFGGKVLLSKVNTERLIVDLWCRGHIREEYVQTPHTVNVYLDVGIESWPLRKMSLQQVEEMVRAGEGKERVVVSVYGKDMDAAGGQAGTKMSKPRPSRPKASGDSYSEAKGKARPRRAASRVRSSTSAVMLSDGDVDGSDLDLTLASDSSSDNKALAARTLKRPASPSSIPSARKTPRVEVLDSSDEELQ